MFTREYVLTGEEMARADRYTSDVLGIPSIVLMERAALSAADIIQRDYAAAPRPVRVAVIAGKGNNGADALAAGRLLLDAGFRVSFFLTFSQKPLPSSGNSEDETFEGFAPQTPIEIQLHILEAYGAAMQPLTEDLQPLTDFCPQVIIDGIFGTGLSRRVEGLPARILSAIGTLRKDTGARVYALDLPSGICAGTGAVLGTAVQADVTVTFAFYKKGHFLYPGCSHCGRIYLCPIGITPRSLAGEAPAFTFRWQEKDALPFGSGKEAEALLPFRRPDGNKGTFGKVLVIAGSKGVCGACILCAKAALRSGAGMVRIFTHASNRVILQETVPEAMCTVYESEEEIRELLPGALAWADVAAVGPGIGLTDAGEAMLRQVLAWGSEQTGAGRGIVLDADALRLLARCRLYDELREAAMQSSVILTPHPGESAELLHTDIAKVQEHTEELYADFVRDHGCTVLAKDARTRVIAPKGRPIYLNTTGNDGLATAGSGDVLTGITAGLLAQERNSSEDMVSNAFAAACAAACLHGRLAEHYAARYAAGSLVASDLIRLLPTVLSEL